MRTISNILVSTKTDLKLATHFLSTSFAFDIISKAVCPKYGKEEREIARKPNFYTITYVHIKGFANVLFILLINFNFY